jgi:hypothetical protein
VDDARQIDANAGMSAPQNAAKCLKGQKSQRNGANNGLMAEDFTQKSLPQTIRPCTSTDDELFRPSLKLLKQRVRLAEGFDSSRFAFCFWVVGDGMAHKSGGWIT